MKLIADSPDGWKDAIEKAVTKASETIHNISGVEVANLAASVKDRKVTSHRADLHLAIRMDD